MLLTSYLFGPLRVLVSDETDEVVAVQDALTGCAASLLYNRAAITHATAQARMAHASLAELA